MLTLRNPINKTLSENNSIPKVKVKAIKYLTLANLTMLAFKTTKDLALLDQVYLFKDNVTQFLKLDILYKSGIPMWQFLLFVALATPAMVINQKDKTKKN